jgi:signal peptidase I
MMKRKTRRRLLRLVTAVPGLYALLAFLTARRVTVRGWSMYPALRPGDRVLFDRLAYWGDRPRRGDLVLAVHPARPGLRMVKRIATPGETFAANGAEPRLLARDEYALLGDNEDHSTDSRDLGPVRRRDILARGWLLYWPLERFRKLP